MKNISIYNKTVSAEQPEEDIEVDINSKSQFTYFGEDVYDKLIWFIVKFKEELNFDFDYHLTTSMPLEEHIAKDFSTFLNSNSYALTDLLSTDFNKVAGDHFSFEDAVLFLFLKDLNDSFSFEEFTQMLVEKQLVDTFSYSETMVFNISKSLVDNYSFLESLFFNLSKQQSESFSISESGTIQNQDCFDPLYANEGYTGTVRTW